MQQSWFIVAVSMAAMISYSVYVGVLSVCLGSSSLKTLAVNYDPLLHLLPFLPSSHDLLLFTM